MIRLKEFRTKKSLTQMQLSAKSGVSQSSIAEIENGKKENPQIGTVLKLAHALDCTVEELVCGKGK